MDCNRLMQIHIWLLYRDDYYDWDSENKGVAEVIADSKMNRGTVELIWLSQYMTFANFDKAIRLNHGEM